MRKIMLSIIVCLSILTLDTVTSKAASNIDDGVITYSVCTGPDLCDGGGTGGGETGGGGTSYSTNDDFADAKRIYLGSIDSTKYVTDSTDRGTYSEYYYKFSISSTSYIDLTIYNNYQELEVSVYDKYKNRIEHMYTPYSSRYRKINNIKINGGDTYYIVIQDEDSTIGEENFTIKTYRDDDNIKEHSEAISVGSTHNSLIDYENDVDYYRIDDLTDFNNVGKYLKIDISCTDCTWTLKNSSDEIQYKIEGSDHIYPVLENYVIAINSNNVENYSIYITDVSSKEFINSDSGEELQNLWVQYYREEETGYSDDYVRIIDNIYYFNDSDKLSEFTANYGRTSNILESIAATAITSASCFSIDIYSGGVCTVFSTFYTINTLLDDYHRDNAIEELNSLGLNNNYKVALYVSKVEYVDYPIPSDSYYYVLPWDGKSLYYVDTGDTEARIVPNFSYKKVVE